MGKMKNNNFKEYIDVVLSKNYKGSTLIVKHTDLLFPTFENIDNEEIEKKGYQLIFHRYLNKIQNPYEPFLDFVKLFVNDKMQNNEQFDLEEFLDNANVYSMHREIIKAYFKGENCDRAEEIILGEYEYELKRLHNSIMKMIENISKEQKLFFVLSEINLADSFLCNIIRKLASAEICNENIKIIATYNSVGQNLTYSKSELLEVVDFCNDRGNLVEWAYMKEGTQEVVVLEENDVSDKIRRLYSYLNLLEYEKALYWLREIRRSVDEGKIYIEDKDMPTVCYIGIICDIMTKDFADALYFCKLYEKNVVNKDIGDLRKHLWISYVRTEIHMYNKAENIARKYLEQCREIVEKLNTEDSRMKYLMLENMVAYSGWRDIWICEKEMEIDPKLIEWCEKNNHYNHLAYMYVYSYNSDYRKLEKTENILSKMPEFNKGLEIARKLGNTALISAAYFKNVMLASFHGYFETCIFFYNRMIEAIKNDDDMLHEAETYNGMGYSYCGLGRYEEASKYYNIALMKFKECGLEDQVIETLYNMGINAILAESYKNACDYFLLGDYILKNLKQSSIKCCHISKYYALLALASYREGVNYQANVYLNYAKSFLKHIIGKDNEREYTFSDDGMFIIYLLDAEMYGQKGEYEKALESLDNAEFYTRRSTGLWFFSYPQLVIDKYDILMGLNRKNEAVQILKEGIEYCAEKGYSHYEEKMRCRLNNEVFERNYNLDMSCISLEDVELWIRKEYLYKQNIELVETIDHLQVLQKIIEQMSGDIDEELSSVITLVKRKYGLDRVVYIKKSKKKGNTVYSDTIYDITKENIDDIENFFLTERKSFLITDPASTDKKYDKILNVFSKDCIISFIGIPCYIGEKLDGVFLGYNEMSDDWATQRRNIIFFEERDLNTLTYIEKKHCAAINSQEMTEELIETNVKLKYQMENMEKLKNAAEQANEAKSRFLANMSHEIRTPINAIIGMNEMIIRECKENNIQEYSSDVNTAAKSLLSIINDILDMSKIESGKLKLVEVEYQIASLVNDIVSMMAPRAKTKGLEFVVKMNKNIPSVLLGDDNRIRQVIVNLLTNAVKYTNEGSILFEVNAAVVGDEAELFVRVKDTGIGIKKEDLGKLSIAFERIEEERNRNIEGTGLGMAITFSLLKMMDTTLTVQSEYGVGSDFSFKIKQKIVNKEGIGQVEEKISTVSDEHNYVPKVYAPEANILVVDDNEMNIKVFESLLKSTGIQIDTAGSGFACLRKTKKKKYDLIFLDHMMPKMDGIETLNRLRSEIDNLSKDVPVVVLTANAIVGAKEEYMAKGFDDYLSKPVEFDKLEKMLLERLPNELIKKYDR